MCASVLKYKLILGFTRDKTGTFAEYRTAMYEGFCFWLILAARKPLDRSKSIGGTVMFNDNLALFDTFVKDEAALFVDAPKPVKVLSKKYKSFVAKHHEIMEKISDIGDGVPEGIVQMCNEVLKVIPVRCFVCLTLVFDGVEYCIEFAHKI